ncbi:NAD-dependent epimerase/dehydratase family protein [soil metagenome]
MRVMVTGAGTPLGAAFVGILQQDPRVERVLAVGHERDEPVLPGPGVRWVTADLRRARSLHDLVWGPARNEEIDVVIHGLDGRDIRCAPLLVRESEDHPSIRRFVYRSSSDVYSFHKTATNLIDEDAAVDFDPTRPPGIRERVEADVAVCSRFGGSLAIAVLRCAEIFSSGVESQLWDYVQSRVCLRPMGFDPMINLLSLEDALSAFAAALHGPATGVLNIVGRDTLPLSELVIESSRLDVPVPGPLLSPLYRLRRRVAGFDFRYDVNRWKLHFGGILDGSRAARELGYVPMKSVTWPRPWWLQLVAKLSARLSTT